MPNPLLGRNHCLRLKPQEISWSHPESSCHFDRPFVSTQGALKEFGPAILVTLLQRLQVKAKRKGGLDYLQVFENLEKGGTDLWFIEDGVAVTALLPSEY